MSQAAPTELPAPAEIRLPAAFTAAQIAAVLGISSQAVRKALAEVSAAEVRLIRGQETKVWRVDQLPADLLAALEVIRAKERCRTVETLLAMPRRAWSPPVPLNEIADEEVARAAKLRDALKPWLQGLHRTDLSAAEIKERGAEGHAVIFKLDKPISPRHWDFLFARARQRDAGAEDWDNLALYLPDKPKVKRNPADVVTEAAGSRLPADGGFATEDDGCFGLVASRIKDLLNPAAPKKVEIESCWQCAMQQWGELVAGGMSGKAAARRLRAWLFNHARFLAPSEDALLKAFNRRLKVWRLTNDPQAIGDQRRHNGQRVEIPAADIDILRGGAANLESGRIDSAWRELYPKLSEATRQRYEHSHRAPEKIHEVLNRMKTDSLADAHKSKRLVRRKSGSIEQGHSLSRSMHEWAVDDLTVNLQVVLTNSDGSFSLIQPQMIVVIDNASHKWVGWEIAAVKGPNAEMVCNAVVDAFRAYGVPNVLGVENGWVFGRALNINGKEDDQGRTVVSGLGQYGCTVRHFNPMNPTSKAALEKSFDLYQRRLERLAGYTGRLQILDAPEAFKMEQRMIEAGKMAPTDRRYTFEESLRLLPQLANDYNNTPQYGKLNGMTPNEAFAAFQCEDVRPTKFDAKLGWWLANARYLVQVKRDGVSFRHYGRTIRARGGELANFKYLGEQLWALVDRRDESMVTFTTKDFSETFTVEVCQKPFASQSIVAPESDILGKERAKIRQQERMVMDEYQRLIQAHGDPRIEGLRAFRQQPKPASAAPAEATSRLAVVPMEMQASAEEMEKQREAIKAGRKQDQAQRRRGGQLKAETGIVLSAAGQRDLDATTQRKLRELTSWEDLPDESDPQAKTSEQASQ